MKDKIDKCMHYWHHYLFTFNSGDTVVNAAREICEVYVENAISDRAAQNGSLNLEVVILTLIMHPVPAYRVTLTSVM